MNHAQRVVHNIANGYFYTEFIFSDRVVSENPKTHRSQEILDHSFNVLRERIGTTKRIFLARPNLGCSRDKAEATFDKWVAKMMPRYVAMLRRKNAEALNSQPPPQKGILHMLTHLF
jgi:hypothetical protein